MKLARYPIVGFDEVVLVAVREAGEVVVGEAAVGHFEIRLKIAIPSVVDRRGWRR